MAALQDLIAQIEDPVLRNRIATETKKLEESKKFGLVFEEHIPECTPLYDVPVNVGSKVAVKKGYISKLYTVQSLDGEEAVCIEKEKHLQKRLKLDEIVVAAEFGEPIYPYLKQLDSVCNAPDSSLWHTLIEADNYHALQLLAYLYAGEVDCIYIDPPYNTRAKDWKYNNDYVDSKDSYRHSKWLSMMEKRLKIAKKLLRKDGALITTIDDNELAHLRILLNEIFPEALSVIISIQMNPGGTQGHAFSVTNEYAIVTYFKETPVYKKEHFGEDAYNLRRWGSTSSRYEGATCFYPIIVDMQDNIVGFGDVLPDEEHPLSQVEVRDDGTKLVWPIDISDIEKKWRYARDNVESVRDRLFLVHNKDRIEVMIKRKSESEKTMWVNNAYNAETYGTNLIKKVIGKGKFSYPKSVYAVKDCLSMIVRGKPDALVVDFFAGSGTTLHALNLLNAEDNGNRRCIMVTNNEVSDAEAKALKKQGFKPGDEEWEKYGIARYVTWPRTVCTIEGHDINNNPLSGDYGVKTEVYEKITEDNDKIKVVSAKTGKAIKRVVFKKVKKQLYPALAGIKQANGFKTNAIYFKLGFLDKTSVALGMQFAALLPILWMKAGAVGPCPSLISEELPKMLILSENKFAVLLDESTFVVFCEEIKKKEKDINAIFFVTDSDSAFRSMSKEFDGKLTYQLYKDYLDNFRINIGR